MQDPPLLLARLRVERPRRARPAASPKPALAESGQRGGGTAFRFGPTGHWLTAWHNVRGAQNLRLVLASGAERRVSLLAADPMADLALLGEPQRRLSEAPRRLAVAGLSASQELIVWGYPEGRPLQRREGRGGGLDTWGGTQAGPLYRRRVTLEVEPGFSGAPVFTSAGAWAGMVLARGQGAAAGQAMLLRAQEAQRIGRRLLEEGAAPRGWLGVRGLALGSLDAGERSRLGLAWAERGVLVRDILAEAPSRSGERMPRTLAVGDLILSVEGTPVEDVRDLRECVARYEPTTVVLVQVQRGDRRLELPVRLSTAPSGARSG